MENETKRPDDKAWADELFFLENAPDGMMRTAAIRAVAAEAERARKSEAAALALNAELVEALEATMVPGAADKLRHASESCPGVYGCACKGWCIETRELVARARRSASEGGAGA
jgi:hypothetical protein